jgi:hypothetical protein
MFDSDDALKTRLDLDGLKTAIERQFLFNSQPTKLHSLNPPLYARIIKEEDNMHNFKYVIDIKKNTLGDTRTAVRKSSFEEFEEANRQHIRDVERVMDSIAHLITRAGEEHDRTKLSKDGEFYRDFCKVLDDPKNDFCQSDWYQMHIKEERHHVTAHAPDDVDLIDILEHIVDCCCAGKTRSGVIAPVVIDSDILQKAVENTVKLIDNNTRIVD